MPPDTEPGGAPEHDGDERRQAQQGSSQVLALRAQLDSAFAVSRLESPPVLSSSARAQSRARDLHDPRLALLLDPDSQRSASFRLLRDNVLAMSTPRIIAVTSGAPHEGKTTCASNLALALCEQPSARVLLVEGSFTAPSLGSLFGIDARTPAASDMDLPWLRPYRVVEIMRGLHVAALAPQQGEPTPALTSRWFDMALGILIGAAYDFLVIDASVLDGSPMPARVVSAADGTLLAARSGATTARSLRRAAERIPKGRALGVVLLDT